MPINSCDHCPLPLEEIEGIESMPNFDRELQQMMDNDSDAWSDFPIDYDPNNESISSDDDSDSFWGPPTAINLPEPVPMEVEQDTSVASSVPDNFDSVQERNVDSVRGRNVATRARRGRNVARRGRHRDNQRGEASTSAHLTPFERGVTFNGFARNLEPEAVTGFTLDNEDGILYSVKWRNFGTESRQIESSLMRMHRPLMLIDYYEAVAKRNNPVEPM